MSEDLIIMEKKLDFVKTEIKKSRNVIEEELAKHNNNKLQKILQSKENTLSDSERKRICSRFQYSKNLDN